MIKPKKLINSLYRTKETSFKSRYNKIRLDRNERTINYNQLIIDEIKKTITDEMLMTYPEPFPLYEKFEDVLNIKKENLIFNLGSDLSIKSIFETYIEENDKILLHDPSYAMYSVYAEMFGAQVVKQEFEKDFSFNYESFIDKIDNSLKMVIFENPNGFLGVEHNQDNILRIIKKAKENDVLIVIDEAYFHYINTTFIDYINEYDNLIIVRTFSKALGLASCRIGYIVTCQININNIYKVKPMHELTQFSINSAIVLLEHFDYVQENIVTSLESLKYLKEELKQLGCIYSNSVANFLVVKLGIKNEEKFEEEISQKGILIRRNFTQEFLKGYRRIGISTVENINQLIEIVRKYK